MAASDPPIMKCQGTSCSKQAPYLKFRQQRDSNLQPQRSLSWFYKEMHHGKELIDGVRWTVKNVIFPKVKSRQIIIYTPLEVTEPIKRFIPLVHAVYLP